jgi:predicted esterase
MKNIVKTIAVITPLLFIGCGDGLDSPEESVKGGELVVNFSATTMKNTLMSKGVATKDTTVFGYKAYKVPYTTTDESGVEVEASGLFVIPTGMPPAVSQIGLSMVSDDHGTIFANINAPSVGAKSYGTPDGSSILLTSLGGFATLQPDYVGFGDSNGKHYHPYVLKKSLASASVDFIKAVKVFATNNDIKLNNQLFITGYSEGGYAAMATLQKIESDGEMSVAMAAPMAGPYDLNLTAFGVLSSKELSVPVFMADIGYAYGKAYDKELSTIINEPYASKLPTLLDGSLDGTTINNQLPYKTTGEDGLFTPSFVGGFFASSEHWFREAVVENSVHAWVPKSSVRLVHCESDDVIPYVIAQQTEGTMKAMGAEDVAIVPIEKTLGLPTDMGHSACGQPAYQIATKMFSDVRKATIGY